MTGPSEVPIAFFPFSNTFGVVLCAIRKVRLLQDAF